MAFALSWRSLFTQQDAVQPNALPRLGIDYVQASAAQTTIPLIGDPHSPLTIQQDLAQLGVAGVVWNCTRALLAFCQRSPSLLHQKRVLELGAGTGALGLALAADALLASLLLTDLPSVVPLTERNVRLAAKQRAAVNDLIARGRLQTQICCWGPEAALAVSKSARVDVVLCSDCFYDESQYANLLATLLALTASTSPVVFFAYKQRLSERESRFFQSAAQSFDIEIVSGDGQTCTEFLHDAIYIGRMTRRRSTAAVASNQTDQ